MVIASYITIGSIAHVFPVIQSVINRCIYVQQSYEHFMGSQYLWSLEDTALHQGHVCLSWTSCCGIRCVPRALLPELEKSLWLFCNTSVSSPGLYWATSPVGFRDQLSSFPLGLSLFLTPNFLPNKRKMSNGNKQNTFKVVIPIG